MLRKSCLAAWVTLLIVQMATAADRQLVPFVIPATPDPQSLTAYPPGDAIATDSPRVIVEKAHFWLNGKPIKFWGVNLTFAANFPEHPDAEQLAIRLSQAGINCVRLHHMDMAPWNGKTGIWDATDPTKLSPEAMDRLDYLLDQLARHGIHADLNLHVSRTHSKYLGLPPITGAAFDKMTDLFMPQIMDAEKDYAQQLLGHLNKYRGIRYADDPVIAIVEISNEDSLFEWGGQAHLETLPEPYASTLKNLFCTWLGHRYGSTAGLRTAWNKGKDPLGDEMIADPQFADLANQWFLEVHEGNTATASTVDDAVHLDIPTADRTGWHIQFQQSKLHLRAGQYYTLKFTARADRARHIGFAVSQAHDPWANLGLDSAVALDKDWKDFSRGFVASDTDDQARVTFELADSAGSVDLKNISLRTGGREGLKEGESLDAKNIALFGGSETQRRTLDTPLFLADTEKAFYDSMAHFIKTDLGCHALVTGTIVFGPLGLYTQSDMDFVDAHAYWQHPQFPGRDWDMRNWIMKQVAMVDHPEQATLFQLAASRLAGKPFTVTEYCHPAPNDFQAECVPEIATYAAAQDWDAVFLFDWGAVPSADRFENFFDNGSNPAKLAFSSSAAAIFRGGAVSPLTQSTTLSFAGERDALDGFAAAQTKFNLKIADALWDQSKTDWRAFLRSRLFVSLKPEALNQAAEDNSSTAEELSWKVDDAGHGMFTATSRGAFVWIGHSDGPDNSPVVLKSPDFAAITLVAMDGEPFSSSKKLLLTSCGRCENTGMKFVPDRHMTVNGFGKGPVLIEPVEASIRIPGVLAAGLWHIQALNASGRPEGAPRDMEVDPDGVIHVDATDQSAWHLLTRD